jgi:hypothetical protein
MRKYIKPSAEIVELSVKESLSALKKSTGQRTFGFGTTNKEMTLTTYSTKTISKIQTING